MCGLLLVCTFSFVLPAVSINGLHKSVELKESMRFAHMRNFILDMIWKAIIEHVAEHAFTISFDLRGIMVKLHKIPINTVVILHGQMVQLMFCISNRIRRSKISLELDNELLIVIHPEWTEIWIIGVEEIRFKPSKRSSLEV